MTLKSCFSITPSSDIEKSLRFWVQGLGLTMTRPMRQDGRLVGCTEFFVTDDDGHSHCFGVPTAEP